MTLPLVIAPNDPGHIDDHQEIHTLLSRLDGQSTFLAAGSATGALGARPAASASNLGSFYHAASVPSLAFSDGAVWREQVLTDASNTFTGINTFSGDVFFGAGAPWTDVIAKGAAGDGITDDLADIQDACDDMATRVDFSTTLGQYIVYFPRPDAYYRTTGPIEVEASMVVLVGASEGVLIQNVTAGTDVVKFNTAGLSAASIAPGIKNLSLKGTGTASRAIYANFLQHFVVDNVNCINHPGPALYMESTNALLSGCVFALIRNLKAQASQSVVLVTDSGGLFNQYEAGRYREAEIAFEFIDAENCAIRGAYIESINRGTVKAGVRATVTENDGPRRTLYVNAYFENCTNYIINANRGYHVIVDGGRSDGGVDEATKARKGVCRLDGGGIVRNFRGCGGDGGTYLESIYGRIVCTESDGVVGAVSRVHFVDVVPPLTLGRTGRNSATESWFDTDPTWAAGGGATAPTFLHDTTNGYLGRGAKRSTFPTGGSGGAFSRANMSNTSLSVGLNEGYYTGVAFKASVSGEAIRLRHVGSGGATDGTIMKVLTGTDWQVAIFSTTAPSNAGTLTVAMELGAALAASTNIWVGAVTASTESNITFLNTEGPTVEDGDLIASRVLLGQLPIMSGTGTPEGSETADVGSLYLRTDGGAGTTLYVKESGTGNTGWAAK